MLWQISKGVLSLYFAHTLSTDCHIQMNIGNKTNLIAFEINN